MLPIVSNLSAGMFDAFCQHMYRCIEDFKIFSKTHDASYEFEQIFKLCNTLRVYLEIYSNFVSTLVLMNFMLVLFFYYKNLTLWKKLFVSTTKNILQTI